MRLLSRLVPFVCILLTASLFPQQNPRNQMIRDLKAIYVSSKTTFVEPHVMIAALQKDKKFDSMSIIITENMANADALLEVDHQKLTFDYTFRLTERRSDAVLCSGKTIAIDGPRAASPLAKLLAKCFEQARNEAKVAEKEKPQ